MADDVVVRNTTKEFDGVSKFTPAPEGTQQAVCVDVVALGERVKSFPGSPTKLQPQVAIVFQVAAVNPALEKRWEISADFTVSSDEKANLRKFLQAWRGRAYTEEELAAGLPLAKLVGANALIAVEHGVAKRSGRTFGRIASVLPLLAGMPKLAPENYERAPYWATRKAEYAAEVAAYKAALPPATDEPPHPADFDEMPESLKDDGDDPLPW